MILSNHSFECFNENTVDQQNQTSSLNSGESETATANEDSIVGKRVKIYVQEKLPFISVDEDGKVLEAQPGVTPKPVSQRKNYFFSYNCILNTNFQETLQQIALSSPIATTSSRSDSEHQSKMHHQKSVSKPVIQ